MKDLLRAFHLQLSLDDIDKELKRDLRWGKDNGAQMLAAMRRGLACAPPAAHAQQRRLRRSCHRAR